MQQARLWQLGRLCNLVTAERSMEALCKLGQQAEAQLGSVGHVIMHTWLHGTSSRAAGASAGLGEAGASCCAPQHVMLCLFLHEGKE